MNNQEALRLGIFAVKRVQSRIDQSVSGTEDGLRCQFNEKHANLELVNRRVISGNFSYDDAYILIKCLNLRLQEYSVIKETDPGWSKIEKKVDRLETAFLALAETYEYKGE